MESKKINQLATELTPALSDLTIIGDPTTGISKKITLSQMASLFTGTVEEYANLASFPLVGVADTIYIALDTNVLYRWDTGLTSYVELSPNIINSLVFSDANGFDGTISLVGSVATLTITTALTTGSVGFIGASGALLQDNANFFWDDTNNRLGIGTNEPTTAIDTFGSGIITRVNGTSTNNAFIGFASAGTNKWSVGNVQSDHRFRIYSEANSSERFTILPTGEVGIGINNPTTKLHIDGGSSALIANLDANVSVAKSISFRSDNSTRINIEVSGTESGSNAGANFFLRTYTDAGALIETPFQITRSTGLATFKNIAITGLTANYLPKSNGSSALSNSQIYDSGTYVGINNTSPQSMLDIYIGSIGTYFRGGSDNVARQLKISSATTTNAGDTHIIDAQSGTGNLVFATTSTERMRITSGGNVGIGTSNVAGISTNYGTLNINGSNGGGIICKVNDTSRGYFYSASEGTYIIEAASAPIFMYTGGSERMRITSGGKILANRTSSTSTDIMQIETFITGDVYSDAYGIMISGNSNFYANYALRVYNTYLGTYVGSISFNSTNTAFNTSSDYRLKEDFKDYSGLELVSKIKTYDFKWKSTGERMYGVVAHELAEIIPYAVMGSKNAIFEDGKINPQGADYSKIVPILVKAIQELTQKVNALENK